MGEVNQCKVHSYAYEPPLQSPAPKASSSNPYLNGSGSWGSSSYRKVEKPGLDILVGCSGSKEDEDELSVGCAHSVFDEIQDAVDSASDGDVITVCAGTYSPFIVNNKSVSIIANDGDVPEIDGGSCGDGNGPIVGVYYNDGLDYSFYLSGFEITGFRVADDGTSDCDGVYIIGESGSFLIDLSGLEVRNITDVAVNILINGSVYIGDTTIYGSGFGGVKIISTSDSSSFNIENVEVYENGGSGIYVEGGGSLEASGLNLHDGYGNGITINGMDASITSSEIISHDDKFGSGIYLIASTLILTDSELGDNYSTYIPSQLGGALQLAVSSEGRVCQVTAENTYWYGNSPHDVSAGDPDGDSDLTYDYENAPYFGTASFYCEYGVGCFDE